MFWDCGYNVVIPLWLIALHTPPLAFGLVIGRASAVPNFGHQEATSSIVVSYYWHFVDVVWVALFAVIYFLK